MRGKILLLIIALFGLLLFSGQKSSHALAQSLDTPDSTSSSDPFGLDSFFTDSTDIVSSYTDLSSTSSLTDLTGSLDPSYNPCADLDSGTGECIDSYGYYADGTSVFDYGSDSSTPTPPKDYGPFLTPGATTYSQDVSNLESDCEFFGFDDNGNCVDINGDYVGYNFFTGKTGFPSPTAKKPTTTAKTPNLSGVGSQLTSWACGALLGTKNCNQVKSYTTLAKATPIAKGPAVSGSGTSGSSSLPKGSGNGGTLNSSTKVPSVQDIVNALPGANIDTSKPDQIISTALNYFFTIIGITAFASFLYSGFMYITSAGDEAKTTTARRNIVWSLTGVVIAIVAMTVLKFVVSNI